MVKNTPKNEPKLSDAMDLPAPIGTMKGLMLHPEDETLEAGDTADRRRAIASKIPGRKDLEARLDRECPDWRNLRD